MDPYSLMRMQSLFAPPRRKPGFNLSPPAPPNPGTLNLGAPRSLPPDQPEEPDDGSGDDYFSLINKLTKPGPQASAYQQMLNNMPREDDYAPTKGQRIAAALSGFGAGVRDPSEGYATSKGIIQEPYETAVRRYGTKLGAAGAGAQLERQGSLDQLKAIEEARALGLRYDQYKLARLREQNQTTYQKGQLQNASDANAIRRTTADNTASYQRGRLNLARTDANTRVSAQKSLDKYHGAMATERKRYVDAYEKRAGGGRNNPYQQAQALQNALLLMKSDKRWSDFILADPNNPRVFTLDDDNGSRTYQDFKKELDRQVNLALKQGTPFPDDESDQDDDSGIEFLSR